MGNEAWGVGDIAQYGDYVLLAYTTKHLVQDGNYTSKAASTRAKVPMVQTWTTTSIWVFTSSTRQMRIKNI